MDIPVVKIDFEILNAYRDVCYAVAVNPFVNNLVYSRAMTKTFGLISVPPDTKI